MLDCTAVYNIVLRVEIIGCSIWNVVFRIKIFGCSIWNVALKVKIIERSICNAVFRFESIRCCISNVVFRVEIIRCSIWDVVFRVDITDKRTTSIDVVIMLFHRCLLLLTISICHIFMVWNESLSLLCHNNDNYIYSLFFNILSYLSILTPHHCNYSHLFNLHSRQLQDQSQVVFSTADEVTKGLGLLFFPVKAELFGPSSFFVRLLFGPA